MSAKKLPCNVYAIVRVYESMDDSVPMEIGVKTKALDAPVAPPDKTCFPTRIGTRRRCSSRQESSPCYAQCKLEEGCTP